MVASSYGTKEETCELRIGDDCRNLEIPLPISEKVSLQYIAIRYLPFANLPMKEHARHLADIEDFIWDSRDGQGKQK